MDETFADRIIKSLALFINDIYNVDQLYLKFESDRILIFKDKGSTIRHEIHQNKSPFRHQ